MKKYPKYLFIGIFLSIFTILSLSSITILQAQKKKLKISNSNPIIENLSSLNSVKDLQTVLRAIATNITPGVVSINIEGNYNLQQDIQMDPFFKFFFGDSERLQREFNTVGSGFIITPDGYLFSNWHVVKDASKITVTLADGRVFKTKLIGADTESDIALLKINAKDLPVVPLGDSSKSEVGDLVVAIGNPFGLSSTFTFGTVSGLGREGVLPGLQRFIQSDVAVNPGNSGGPLLNINGQAIGINTAIRSRSGGYEGISFAIPINTARHIAEQLFSSGTIERGYLGIVPQKLDKITRRTLNLDPNEGVLISSLEAKGPASVSGLMQGDIITKIDKTMISDPRQLTEVISVQSPKSSVEIEILRNNSRHKLIITLGNRPSSIIWGDNTNSEKSISPSIDVVFKGVTFTSPNSKQLQMNGASSGVFIQNINPESPLSFILSSGDIVSAINNIPTPDIQSLKDIVDSLSDTRSFTFAIYKNGYLVYRSIEY